MDAEKTAIRPLPDTVIAQLKSSTIINTLSDVAVGLAKNSLDASATRIDVDCDFFAGHCKVEDNGHGIPTAAFAEGGGLFKHYWTSKHDASGVHGRSGTFLASLAALSRIIVTSLSAHGLPIASLEAQYSLAGRRMSSSESGVAPAGTRVVVRNLFGNMPVRVKQREALKISEDSEADREWAHFSHGLLSLLLAWPRGVAMLVKDGTGNVKLHVRPTSGERSGSRPASLSRPQLERLLNILTCGGVISLKSWPSWVPITGSNSSYRIKGAISLDPVTSRRHQFLSIDIVPLHQIKHSNPLYDEINRVFAASRFGVEENEALPDEHELQRRSKDRRYKHDGFTGKQLHGGRRGIDRWPMFCLQISAAADTEQQLLLPGSIEDRKSQFSRLLDLLGTMITQWLAEYQFRPQKWRLGHADRSELSSKPTPPALVHSTNGNERSPVGQGWPSAASKPPSEKRHEPSLGHEYKRQPPASTAVKESSIAAAEGQLLWIHPITRERHIIDAMSGGIVARGHPTSQEPDLQKGPRNSGTNIRKMTCVRLEDVHQRTERVQSPWIGHLLREWDNPIFANSEETIAGAGIQIDLDEADNGRCEHHSTIVEPYPRHLSTAHAVISSMGLLYANVVSQLDGKFILVCLTSRPSASKVAGASDSTQLVLIDQHAADERIKVEALLRSLCSSTQGATLGKPLSFEVRQPDVALLEKSRRYFRRWGISYALEKALPTQPHQLMVRTLPISILERCVASPQLLIEMMRAETHDHVEKGRAVAAPKSVVPEQSVEARHEWLRQISDCPRGMIEMLNSQACRSAIMFNDHLSVEDCKALIARLAGCALPFQCAHGRPSMIPLTRRGDAAPFDEYAGSEFRSPPTSFASRYTAWQLLSRQRTAV